MDISLDKFKESDIFETTALFDFIVVGGGPAGLNAALYAKRKGLKVGVFTPEVGGQLHNTSEVDNYIGIQNIKGGALSDAFLKHTLELKVPIKTGHMVTQIEKIDGVFEVTLDNKKVYKSKTLLYATGGSPRKLQIPGEEQYANIGVSYCTTCDAPFFKNEHVIVAGGGNSAAESVIDLAAWASKITVVHRSQWRADQILLDQHKKIPNLTVHLETQLLEVYGDGMRMKGVKAFDKVSQKEIDIPADGLFIEIGTIPKSDLIKHLAEVNEVGEVIVDRDQMTTCPGLFSAGDVTTQPYKQIIISAGEGATAALAATNYIIHHT